MTGEDTQHVGAVGHFFKEWAILWLKGLAAAVAIVSFAVVATAIISVPLLVNAYLEYGSLVGALNEPVKSPLRMFAFLVLWALLIGSAGVAAHRTVGREASYDD